MTCLPELNIDRESVESIIVTVTGPGDLTAMVWQYALLPEGSSVRTWVSATTLPTGVQCILDGTQAPGRYTLFVRGALGAPTLQAPGSVLIT